MNKTVKGIIEVFGILLAVLMICWLINWLENEQKENQGKI